jgi:23S rRNA (guanine745-N1)-methyltransferase
MARSGYCNLLQPQDRRSRQPGDSAEAVAARRQFLDRFRSAVPMAPLFESGGMAAALQSVIDVGCGEGYYLGAMQKQFGAEAHGVDISVAAIDLAARRYRDCFFVVANADRFLPYADKSFDLVTSITSRMNPDEFRRVLKNDGRLLVALAGPDDLIELREAVLGEGKLIDRVERTVSTFGSRFVMKKHERVRQVVHLDRDAIHDVMASSYRGLRASQRERLAALADIDVTFSRDVLLFTCRS